MKASVGRVVHYFTKIQDQHVNGAGDGPYAAIVTQVFPGSDFVNLKVFAPFVEPRCIGSVREKSVAGDDAVWWEWPAKV